MRYPSDQRKLGTERDSARRPGRIFPTSLTGDVSRDVTSEIAEDDFERDWIFCGFLISGLHDLPSDTRAFSLASFQA